MTPQQRPLAATIVAGLALLAALWLLAIGPKRSERAAVSANVVAQQTRLDAGTAEVAMSTVSRRQFSGLLTELRGLDEAVPVRVDVSAMLRELQRRAKVRDSELRIVALKDPGGAVPGMIPRYAGRDHRPRRLVSAAVYLRVHGQVLRPAPAPHPRQRDVDDGRLELAALGDPDHPPGLPQMMTLRNTPRLRDESGFTLTELLLAMSLGLIVLMSSLSVLDSFSTRAARQTRITAANDLVRNAMDRVVSDLRQSRAIEVADANDVVYTVTDAATAIRRERICRNSSTGILWRSSVTTASPPATPIASGTACPTPSSNAAQITSLRSANSASNPLFTYDSAAAASVAPRRCPRAHATSWPRSRPHRAPSASL